MRYKFERDTRAWLVAVQVKMKTKTGAKTKTKKKKEDNGDVCENVLPTTFVCEVLP